MRTISQPNGRSVIMYDSTDPASVVPPTLINSYSVLTIPAYLRAMNFLAQNLASFPRSVQKDEVEPETSHPLDYMLQRRPNSYQNPFIFWRTLFFHACHTANGFARIERNALMQPIAIHNMDAGDVLPFRIDQQKGAGIEQWYYVRSTKDVFPGADVIHLSGLGVDGMVGVDPIHLNADTFQRAKTLDKYQTRYLMRGTVLRGSVEIPGSMDAEQIQAFRQVMRSNFRGAEAEDDVIILTDGAKLNNATMTPEESQLIESCAYSTKQIAQVTGVHPYFLYDDRDGKYNNNTEQAGIDVVRYTFRLWIEQAEDELTGKLLSDKEQQAGFTVHIDPSSITRGDSATITSTLVAQTNAGLRTANEGRQVLGLPAHTDPKSDTLVKLGDTTVNQKVPTSPMKAAALPGPKFGQWDSLAGYDLDALDGDEPFRVNVHADGAIGKDVALQYFPPGATLEMYSAIGRQLFSVDTHAPHEHPNWVIPTLVQSVGTILPSNPNPIHLGHIAQLAAGSKIMGTVASVTVRKSSPQ